MQNWIPRRSVTEVENERGRGHCPLRLYNYKINIFDWKSGFHNRKSGFFNRKSGFFLEN